jgi:hypothetical protein
MNFVLKTEPRHLTENVKCDSSIQVWFMIDIQQSSLRDETIVLFNLTEQKRIPIRFQYRNRCLTITPVEALSPSMHYQLILIGGEHGLRDITGRVMIESYEVEFFTANVLSIKPPVLLTPTHLSEVSSPPTFSWEEVENAYAYELQISKSHTFQSLVWPTEPVLVFDAQVKPKLLYETGQYYVRIRSVGEDGTRSAYSPVLQFYYREKEDVFNDEENKEASPSVMVRLQAQSRLQEPKLDALSALQQHFANQTMEENEKLYILASRPVNQSWNLPFSSMNQIVVEFSEDLDPSSIHRQTCYMVAERN